MSARVLVASPSLSLTGPLSPATSWDWLIRLRWTAVIGQTLTILGVHFWLPIHIPVVTMLSIVAGISATNVVLHGVSKRLSHVPANRLVIVLLLDALALTGLLAYSGGPNNPFSSFYLIHITMAAMLVDGLWTAILCLWCSLCYICLFFLPYPESHLVHTMHGESGWHPETNLHLQGMLVSFVLTATAISYFVIQLNSSIRQHQQELVRAQDLASQSERSAALTALAAGVAHELGSPLGSIAVASHELSRHIKQTDATSNLLASAQFIREEVNRCRLILNQINPETIFESTGDSLGYSIGSCLEEMRSRLTADQSARVRLEDTTAQLHLHLPRLTFVQTLVSLIQNALQASGPNHPVDLHAAVTPSGHVQLKIVDRGVGMDSELLARLGSPFVTTKGSGKGLGLFLTRRFVQQVGGSLEISSEVGCGTIVLLCLPKFPVHPSPPHERHPKFRGYPEQTGPNSPGGRRPTVSRVSRQRPAPSGFEGRIRLDFGWRPGGASAG